jgi:uracil-DNA glycosylase
LRAVNKGHSVAAMGIIEDIADDWHAALAALAWQVDLGAVDAFEDAPIDRYAQIQIPESAPEIRSGREQNPDAVAPPATDPIAVARQMSAAAQTLAQLHANLAAYDLCDIKKGSRKTVFADGNPAARVLIIGDAPGRDEDGDGRPFVGAAGQMLDRMFAAIGLSRTASDPASSVYITYVMPWRPPGDRDALPAEIQMMVPFVERHIELAAPDVIVLMGNAACEALLNQRGILQLRGQWTTALGRSVLPMSDPVHLLRNPLAKREAWSDLLALRHRLDRDPV